MIPATVEFFLDRISWALSYLNMAKLIERPKRGHYRITDLGRSKLGDDAAIRTYIKEKAAEDLAQKKARENSKSSATNTPEAVSSPEANIQTTPIEALTQAYDSIRGAVYDEILDTTLNKTPYEFEKLVVKLLDNMGYGGLVSDTAQVTQQSNDGGIDGIIKEDILGLGRIHIQAKRYRRDITIGREDIQKFVGALAVAKSNKGVFITTSSYTARAIEYAESLNGITNIVLIDGIKLAEYIYDFGLGMQTEETVVIKRMDSDYWDKMQDEESKDN